MKTRLSFLVLVPSGAFLIGVALYAASGQALIAPGVSYASLKKVRVGMSGQELTAALGIPLSISSNTSAVTYLEQSQAGQKENTYVAGRIVTLTYAQPRWGSVFRTQPALWVQLIDGRVSSVYAKEYCFGNDGVLFSVSQSERCENPYARDLFGR